ncbi:RNA polymerase sigma factor, sigma-70 family [Singulisphaera sp. GP187]|uniref:RNA polymerase sigma factor n=1 Tax=Singulisphaera sp. GP187 TaxID=1882752 RepID=UPI000928A715|nr:sigma-70 family RNA polymerase sigma factor [Singulisphaera sp. GP187]SIO31263.1 RNA polymerase sigma factor, sigma-70 family [Singulisphaera sp. GP187]
MANRNALAAGRDVHTLFRVGAVGGLTDGELVERFVSRQEGGAESAFAILVERHGPMVWGVCNRVLNDPHAAADAFQATFLVLVRRAAVIRVDDSLGRWLYGVSRRIALRAKRATARRSAREVQGVETLTAPEASPALERTEWLARLDEEIGQLPERYRAAVVLCDLNGLRHEDAARQLGCAVGTVGSRLARGRDQLRARLIRRGLAPSAGLVAASLAAEAIAAPLPAQLARLTIQSATHVAMNPATFAEVVSVSVASLAEGALKSMVATQWKVIAVALLTTTLVAGGTVVHALQSSGTPSNDVHAKTGTSETPKGSSREGQPPATTRPDAELAEQLRNEIDLLEAQLAKQRGEVAKAEGQRKLALAHVATNARLNERNPGMVSKEEVARAEAGVDVALAQCLIATAEAREAELPLVQANRAKSDPERLKEYLARSQGAGTSSLDRRIERVEQKLDQILKALKPSGR